MKNLKKPSLSVPSKLPGRRVQWGPHHDTFTRVLVYGALLLKNSGVSVDVMLDDIRASLVDK